MEADELLRDEMGRKGSPSGDFETPKKERTGFHQAIDVLPLFEACTFDKIEAEEVHVRSAKHHRILDVGKIPDLLEDDALFRSLYSKPTRQHPYTNPQHFVAAAVAQQQRSERHDWTG